MSKTIPGVPEFIVRDDLLDWVRGLGVDPDRLLELHVTTKAVHVLLRSTLDGTSAMAIDGEHIGKHQLHIPVVTERTAGAPSPIVQNVNPT
jgi:hypothetical protein